MHDIEICRTPSYIAETIILDYISEYDDHLYSEEYLHEPTKKEKIERSMRIYSAKKALNKILEDPYGDPLEILLREKRIITGIGRTLLKSKYIDVVDAMGDTMDCLIDVLSDVLNERKYL